MSDVGLHIMVANRVALCSPWVMHSTARCFVNNSLIPDVLDVSLRIVFSWFFVEHSLLTLPPIIEKKLNQSSVLLGISLL